MMRVGGNMKAFQTMPAAYALVATGSSAVNTHVKLKEGDYCDLLEEADANGEALVRTQKADPEQRIVGYFPRQLLLTEDEIYQRFIAEEDERIRAELERQKREADEKEAAYEAQLRQKMLAKAEQDRKQRVIDAENARLEAERMQRELEERQKLEAEEQRRLDEARRLEMQEKARQLAAAEAKRIEEARKNKELWDAQEQAAKDAEYLSKLPAWKREMVLKKREDDARRDPSLSTVFPGAGR